MKHLLVTLLFLNVFGTIQAQKQITIPGFTITAATPVGTKITLVITNPGSEPITLAPEYNYPGQEHAFHTFDSLVQCIKRYAISTDQATRKMQKRTIIRHMISGLYINNMWLPSDYLSNIPDSLRAKMYALPSAFSFNYHSKCNWFQVFAATLAVASGDNDFQCTDFQEVVLPDHTTMREHFPLGWVKTDYDPNQPNFIQPDNTSPTGYMDVDSIIAHPEKLTLQYKWVAKNGDSILVTRQTMDEYRSKFYSATYYNIVPIALYSNPGITILAPGASITITDIIPYLVDGTDPAKEYAFNRMVDSLMLYHPTNNPSMRDTANAILASLGIPGDALIIIRLGKLELFTNHWKRRYQNEVPTKKFIIPTVTDTLFAGEGKSFYDPGIILDTKVYDGGSLVLNNQVQAWAPDEYALNFENFAHIDDGELLPGQRAEIEVSRNPVLWNIHQGFTLDIFGASDSLRIERYVNDTLVETPVTRITDPIAEQSNLRIYPNPAHDAVMINTDKDDVAVLSDLRGVIVGEQVVHPGVNRIDVSIYATGMYLVKTKNAKTAKITIF